MWSSSVSTRLDYSSPKKSSSFVCGLKTTSYLSPFSPKTQGYEDILMVSSTTASVYTYTTIDCCAFVFLTTSLWMYSI